MVCLIPCKIIIISLDDEKSLVEEVFANAVDALSDEDKHLPQVEADSPEFDTAGDFHFSECLGGACFAFVKKRSGHTSFWFTTNTQGSDRNFVWRRSYKGMVQCVEVHSYS